MKRRLPFDGTDDEYVHHLEEIILRTLYVHPSPLRLNKGTCDSNPNGNSNHSLNIITYKPESRKIDLLPAKRQRIKRPEEAPEWKKKMNEMLDGLSARGWPSERKAIGLSTAAEILLAFDILIGSQGELASYNSELSVVPCSPSNAVQLLHTVGSATAAIRLKKTFAIQIYYFYELVFVSICCVALYHGEDRDVVDKIMKEYLGDLTGKHLDRLLSGARWANRMMWSLAADGSGYRAYELFVIRGRSLAQYGKFAMAGDAGCAYFTSHVPKLNPVPVYEIQASLPFWIPFIIKVRCGDLYRIKKICSALTNGEDVQIQNYPRYLENYRKRQMPLPHAPLDRHLQGGETNVNVSQIDAFPATTIAQVNPSNVTLPRASSLLVDQPHGSVGNTGAISTTSVFIENVTEGEQEQDVFNLAGSWDDWLNPNLSPPPFDAGASFDVYSISEQIA